MTVNKTVRQIREYNQKIDKKAYYKLFMHKLKSENPPRCGKRDLIRFCKRKINNIDKLLYYK